MASAFRCTRTPDWWRADALKAATTPEAFVLDHNSVLRYRGRIDNAYSARLKKSPQVTQHDLKNALDDLLAGKPVAHAGDAGGRLPDRPRDGRSAAETPR